jgi:hypothetical protein
MGNQLKVYVLQNTPLIELNGERIELSSMIQDFFVYLAVENKRSYARKYLGNLLFQPHGPDYLRTAVIGKIDKRIKDICLPESGRGNLLYESSYVWVDALEFADLVKEGLSLYQTPRQETVLLQAGTLYEDNFLAEYQFYWTDWHKTQQRRFLKSFASMAEALIRYYIIVRKPELAVPYAEQWQIRQPDNYLPIQYLIWLSVTLKRKNDIDYHIDQLDQLARNSHTFTLGLTPQEWYQLIREKKEATFDILDIEIEEIHPRDLIETVPPPILKYSSPV